MIRHPKKIIGTILIVITSLLLLYMIFISMISYLFYPNDFTYGNSISFTLDTFVMDKYPEIKKLYTCDNVKQKSLKIYASSHRWNHETKYIDYRINVEVEPSKLDYYFNYVQDNVLSGKRVSDFQDLDTAAPFAIDAYNATVSFRYFKEIEYKAQYPKIVKDVIVYAITELFIKMAIILLFLVLGIYLIRIKD